MRVRIRTHLETIIVAGVVGVLVAGGPAVAGPLVDFAKRSGDADRVDGLSASRTPRAGQLLALNASKRFPASVVPAGAAGAAGATGPAGPAGANGATGSPGAKGDTGPAGAKGETGAAGHDGIDGTNGVDGTPGAKGDTGATGAAGSNGADGAPGIKGDTGAPGAKGDKGDTGTSGAKGDTGAPGEKGETGSAGANGSNGADGAPGPKGDKGDKGETGAAGSAAAYPPIVDVNPFLRPSRSNLWNRVQQNGGAWFNGYRSSYPNGTDESHLEWDIPLQAGTWTIDVVHVMSDDAGILSLSLDGSSLGPGIDAYRPQADGFALNEVGTFAGVDVATTGIHTLRIATPTKNPASAGYFGYLTWIRLVRE